MRLKGKQDVSRLDEQEMVWMEPLDGRTECETKQRGRGTLRSACCFDHENRCEQKEIRQQIRKTHPSHLHGEGVWNPEPTQPPP